MVVLAASIFAAGAFAIVHTDSSASAHVAAPPAEANDTTPLLSPPAQGLPPGHPKIGATTDFVNGAQGAMLPVSSDTSEPALTWTTPSTWKTLPSTSTMRLATYRIPRAPGDTEDTDLSVVRAGGTTDANIERWIGQFDSAGKDTRTTQKIRGMTVTVVDVRGTYISGGMSADNAAASHPNWALLAAIVDSAGSPYFFKMTGPAKSVTSARPAFDALIASVTPTSP